MRNIVENPRMMVGVAKKTIKNTLDNYSGEIVKKWLDRKSNNAYMNYIR